MYVHVGGRRLEIVGRGSIYGKEGSLKGMEN